MTKIIYTNTPDNRERRELVPKKATEHEDYSDDTSADPEGAEARMFSNEQYPDWVFNDYGKSNLDVWGRRYKDGKTHLSPKANTIQGILDVHKASEKHYGDMVQMGLNSEGEKIELLLEHYHSMIVNVPDNYVFPIMRGIANTVQTALAERAYRKYLFINGVNRQRDPEAPMPEFVEKLQDSMFSAASFAGVWFHVHKQLWDVANWKGQPSYRIENDVKSRLQNSATYIEKTYRTVQSPHAPMNQHAKMAINC